MSKQIGLKDMCRHIDELLAQCEADAGGPEDFHVHWCTGSAGAFAINSPHILEIHIPPIRSALSYATCLHEIGHIKGRYQRSKNFMVVEHWAWQWARAHALIWTPAMERSARESMEWYARQAAKRGKGGAPRITHSRAR